MTYLLLEAVPGTAPVAEHHDARLGVGERLAGLERQNVAHGAGWQGSERRSLNEVQSEEIVLAEIHAVWSMSRDNWSKLKTL